MDSNTIKTPSRKDLKPKTHHFFYVLVFILGTFAPPVAVAVRFGIGRDFFINVLCTICGYFPGHGHNFYCQTIRNNSNAARTPKWAVKYGLVSVSDKRGGKHQWAGRYDERLPDSAQAEYNNDGTNSINGGNNETWNGQGPEPPRKDKVGNNFNHRTNSSSNSGNGGRSGFSPWSNEVDISEVEGGSKTLEELDEESRIQNQQRGGNQQNYGKNGKKLDPINNEEFYASTPQTASTVNNDLSSSSSTKGKKSKGIGGLFKHKNRYESQPESSSSSNTKGDRFDRMNSARNGSSITTGGGDEYADEFERELNTGSESTKKSNNNNGNQSFDEFEHEGPEDAFGNNRNGNGGDPLSVSKGPVKTSTTDSELFNHTF